MTYTGKKFEQDFVASFGLPDKEITLLRLYDTTNGFRGIKNPCDFVLGTFFGTGYVELKTTKGSSFPFSNITDQQWSQMTVADYSLYTFCGVLVYFQSLEKLVWYPIRHLNKLKLSLNKSVNPEKQNDYGFAVQYVKKRTRIRIDIESLIKAFQLDWEELHGKT